MPRSAFRGTYRPRRILLAAKCYDGQADGRRCLVQHLGGRAVCNAFYLRQNATVVGRFGAAGCFAGFVQFLLLNKNCTRAADEFYLADKLSPPALGRDAFCLAAKCYGADGGRCHVQCLGGHAVCNAFYLR